MTKAPLYIVVKDATKMYGDSNPTFDCVYYGLKNGESYPAWVTSPDYQTEATKTSDIGIYPIQLVNGVARNYDIYNCTNGRLIVNPAPLVVKANNIQRPYYEENPSLSYTCIGFRNSDNNSVFITQPKIECNATLLSDSGEYPITVEGGSCRNYMIEYENGTLTIRKRTLQVKPVDAMRKYGEENPVFECTLNGFVGNQDESVIDEMPNIYTTATPISDVGKYSIYSSGGSATNYDFNYDENGVLTIEKAEQTIVWEQDLSHVTVGSQVELQAYSTSGLEIEYLLDTNIASIYKVGNIQYLDCFNAGVFSLRATQPGNKNYNAAVRVAKSVVVGTYTGINERTETIDRQHFEVYDLNGRKVRLRDSLHKDLPKGVYIISGRKVIK